MVTTTAKWSATSAISCGTDAVANPLFAALNPFSFPWGSVPKDKFDDETKAKVRKAAEEAMEYQREITRQATAEGITFLQEKGMEVYEPTAEELQAFREATKPAFDTWAAKVGDDLVKSFQDTVAANK